MKAKERILRTPNIRRKKKPSVATSRKPVIQQLESLPELSNTSAMVGQIWEQLGPAPDVLCDKL